MVWEKSIYFQRQKKLQRQNGRGWKSWVPNGAVVQQQTWPGWPSLRPQKNSNRKVKRWCWVKIHPMLVRNPQNISTKVWMLKRWSTKIQQMKHTATVQPKMVAKNPNRKIKRQELYKQHELSFGAVVQTKGFEFSKATHPMCFVFHDFLGSETERQKMLFVCWVSLESIVWSGLGINNTGDEALFPSLGPVVFPTAMDCVKEKIPWAAPSIEATEMHDLVLC